MPHDTSPPPSRPDPRAAILDAAAGLVGASSPLDMSAVAAAAGVSRATLYRYFADREAVALALRDERKLPLASPPDARTRIVAAAQKLFLRRGPAHVTMEQVATEANVGVATVYRHFGDKGALVMAIADNVRPREASQRLQIDRSLGLEESLAQFATHLASRMYTMRSAFRLVFADLEENEALFARLRDAPNRTYHALVAFFADAQLRGEIEVASPERAATSFIGVIMGSTVISSVFEMSRFDPTQAEEFGRYVARLFVHGLATRREADGKGDGSARKRR